MIDKRSASGKNLHLFFRLARHLTLSFHNLAGTFLFRLSLYTRGTINEVCIDFTLPTYKSFIALLVWFLHYTHILSISSQVGKTERFPYTVNSRHADTSLMRTPRYYKLPLLRTLTRGPDGVRNNGSDCVAPYLICGKNVSYIPRSYTNNSHVLNMNTTVLCLANHGAVRTACH